jgi:branched-chain amino acid transport system permease protein
MTAAERLKDAILAAGVAALLALPLIGFETIDTGGPLGIKTRFDYIAYAAIAVFLGRLGMRIALDWRRNYRESQADKLDPVEAVKQKSVLSDLGRKADKWLMPVLIGFAIIMPFLPFANRTVIDLGTVVLIYVMLGWGLNIVVGLAGLLDLGYVAFYAVGAYTFALLSMHFGFGFWETLPLAGLLAATFGVVLGFPVLRLRGDYLAIVTLGFGEIIRVILLNWQPVTGGPAGISGIPRPSFFGYPFSADPPAGTTSFHQLFNLEFASLHRITFLYYLILALALITNIFTMRIRKLPVGRAWEALREDEIACTALGINPTNTKLTAFAIGAMFGGFAGSFFAARQGFISPESFSFIESAVILAIVVLGGMGSQAGIVLAAAFLTLLPEVAREFSLFRMLAFGAAMVLIMVWRPQGLLAHREPTMRLHPVGAKPGGGKP